MTQDLRLTSKILIFIVKHCSKHLENLSIVIIFMTKGASLFSKSYSEF